MKLSKQELKQKISDSIKDNDDLVISLLEDVEDSMVENNESVLDETKMKEYEDLKYRYEDLKNRYKERFLKGEEKIDDKKDSDEMSEEEIVEKDDIFEKVKEE